MLHSQALLIRYRLVGVVLLSTIMMISGVVLASGWMTREPLIKIGVVHKGTNLPDGFFVYQQLTSHGVSIKSITTEQGALVIHLENEEQRLAALKVLQQILSDSYTST